jgi:hypothetical protein
LLSSVLPGNAFDDGGIEDNLAFDREKSTTCGPGASTARAPECVLANPRWTPHAESAWARRPPPPADRGIIGVMELRTKTALATKLCVIGSSPHTEVPHA